MASKEKKCPSCGSVIQSKRSVAISTHFHSHITQIARETGLERFYVYFSVLLLAVEIEVDGGLPYPYVIIKRMIKSPISGDMILHDLVEPYRTSYCNNRQMMTAVEACHLFATTKCIPAVILVEKCWFCKGKGCELCNYTGKEQFAFSRESKQEELDIF